MKNKLTSLLLGAFIALSTTVACANGTTTPNTGHEPEPNPEPKPDSTYTIKSFVILKKDNPSLSGDIKFENISANIFCAHLSELQDASSLVASFELSAGQLIVENKVQVVRNRVITPNSSAINRYTFR